MLKTNRENPGGSVFRGRSSFSPAPAVTDNSQYDPSNYATESAGRFGAQGADDDTAALMGSIYDLGVDKPSGLSQIKLPSSNEGITATPGVLSAPSAPPAPTFGVPPSSGLSGISGSGGSASYMGGPKTAPKNIL